ncbi:MAG: hypothetical protein FWC87_08640 [Acidimicrobiaceae bacterium]|nr:hypothetical protein [Acidimicrobiaceae bacterium]
MTLEADAVTQAFLEHLTATDRALLLAADPERGRGRPEDTRAAVELSVPGRLEHLLSSPQVFESVFLPGPPDEPLLAASPFLVFAVAVGQAAGHLSQATYVTEWLGPGQRAPIFDVAPLRDFLAEPGRRLFLAELLASYTRVSSGSVIVSTRRGRRRQRFSELDPVRLAGLLEVVPEAERTGVLRRLGDLALFLTGVFPDHVARQGFGTIEEGRLRRAGRLVRHPSEGSPAEADGAWEGLGDGGAVGLLERLGRTWYRAASDRLEPPIPLGMRVVGELPERFGQARRILNLVTDRFLFVQRERWFGRA